MTFAYKEKASTVDEKESRRVLQRAPELGCSFLDTSDVYGYELAHASCNFPCLVYNSGRDKLPVCADPTRMRRSLVRHFADCAQALSCPKACGQDCSCVQERRSRVTEISTQLPPNLASHSRMGIRSSMAVHRMSVTAARPA